MTITSHLKRYAMVHGRKIEYYERPDSIRGEKYREPRRVHPQGFKDAYRTKAEALDAKTGWEKE